MYLHIFISLTVSLNGAQFLNTTFLSPLSGLPSPCAEIDIVLLTSIYASLKSYTLDLTSGVLNLI